MIIGISSYLREQALIAIEKMKQKGLQTMEVEGVPSIVITTRRTSQMFRLATIRVDDKDYHVCQLTSKI